MVRSNWREYARQLKAQALTIYLACRDPRTPWYAKLLAACVAGYAFSPIDLIPDFIPVIGYLDDLVLVPLGIALVMKLVPAEVLADCRRKAEERVGQDRPTSWMAGAVIIVVWTVAAAAMAMLALRWLRVMS